MKKIIFSHEVLRWSGILCVSMSIIVLAFVFRERLVHLRSLGLFGIFLANLLGSAIPFLPVPGIVTVVAGGALYSPVVVAVLATIGAVIGDMLTFLIGVSGRKLLLRKEYKTYERLVVLMKKYGAIIIFLFAFVPNPIFDTIGVLAGVLEYPPYNFFVWLFLGRLTRNLLLAFFGAQF